MLVNYYFALLLAKMSEYGPPLPLRQWPVWLVRSRKNRVWKWPWKIVQFVFYKNAEENGAETWSTRQTRFEALSYYPIPVALADTPSDVRGHRVSSVLFIIVTWSRSRMCDVLSRLRKKRKKANMVRVVHASTDHKSNSSPNGDCEYIKRRWIGQECVTKNEFPNAWETRGQASGSRLDVNVNGVMPAN